MSVVSLRFVFCTLLVCRCSHAKILIIMETAEVSVDVNTGVLCQELGTMFFIGC